MACVKPKVNVEVFTLTSVQYVNGRVENVYVEINMYVKLGSYPWSGAEWLRQSHHSPYYKTLYLQNDFDAFILRKKKVT